MDAAHRAVELDPNNPVFLNTLAEVQFQRGDRKSAIESIRRCIKAERAKEATGNSSKQIDSYLQQLKRFETLGEESKPN